MKIKTYSVFWISILHIACIYYLFFDQSSINIKKNKKTFIVKNVIIQKPQPIKHVTPIKQSQPRKTVTAKNNNQKKKLPKIEKQEKKPSPQNLLNKLEDSIKNLEKTSNVSSQNTLSIPKQITTLNIDNKEKVNPTGYKELLVEELKNNLNLPDYGEVKVKITINIDGSITNVVIIEAKSKKNQDYLKNTLPQLVFPWFNQYVKEQTNLMINFKNAK